MRRKEPIPALEAMLGHHLRYMRGRKSVLIE
jgi:hypothetical protein